MNLLKALIELFEYLYSNTKDERKRKEREEEAAYRYVWVLRERDYERRLLLEKKAELAAWLASGKVDADAAQGLRQEMDLKERLLDSQVMEIERTEYNAWILDGFEKEKEERRRIREAYAEISRLESEGNTDADRLDKLRDELRKKEAIMDKAIQRMPR